MNLASVPTGPRSQASFALRDVNEGEVALEPRGIRVYLELRDIDAALDVGIIPQPITRRVMEKAKAGEEFTEAELEEIGEQTQEAATEFEEKLRAFVASCITAVNDKPGPLTAEDTHQFSKHEMNQLVAYVMREKPLPGKG